MTTRMLVALFLVGTAAGQAQKPKASFDLPYWSAVGAYTAATAWDVYTTQRGYEQSPTCHETGSAWLLGKRPSAAREAATEAAEVAAAAWLAHRMKRSRRWRKLWTIPLAVGIEQHVRGAVNNEGVCQ